MLAMTWFQSMITAVVAIAATLPPAGTPEADPPPPPPKRPAQVSKPKAVDNWVASWSSSVTQPSATGVSATGVTALTFRQVAHLSLGGSAVRVRLSNKFGNRPLVIGRMTVAPRNAAAAGTANVDLKRVAPVTFGKRPWVSIPPGRDVLSDPVRVAVAEDSDLVISTYFPYATGRLTQHPNGYATAYAAKGDQTSRSGAPYRKIGGMARFVISAVDVRTRSKGSLVMFGDSITDGPSPMDRNLRYPDQLADLLQSRRIGVVNAGIGGNRLLANGGTAGDAAVARFERDVVRQSGIRGVVILVGINDIRASRGAISATQLINAHKALIWRARSAGLKVYGGTLTPFWAAEHYTVGGEVARQAVNHWIRTTQEYDGVIDFERAVRDPKAPLQLLPRYDSGDHLHPNTAGLTAMVRAIDPRLLGN